MIQIKKLAKERNIILIEDDVHHKVSNTDENEQLYFVCVFDGTRSH